MTVPLFPWRPPNVVEIVIAWLLPLGTAQQVGATRPDAGSLPYRMVNRVSGHDDKITESSIVSIHTFDTNYTAAEASAQTTHERMLLLGPPIVAQQPVTISTGTVMVDCVDTKLVPVYLDYEDDLIFRFVARYEISARFS